MSKTSSAMHRPTASFVLTLSLLALGLVPLPEGTTGRWVRQCARSLEPKQEDRKETEAGYYEGLINVGVDGDRNDLASRLVGKPTNWVSFHDIGATHYLHGDLLQFELKPNLSRTAFGRPFETNAFALRDREYTFKKPPGVFRIAVLGSSIDMGWGVDSNETYENRLEDWLNAHAEKVGSERRFEVLNFSMAAYSPVQRFEALKRKALRFQPDLVLMSLTMLDIRLLQIHWLGMLEEKVDPSAAGHPYLNEAFDRAGISADEIRLGPDGHLVRTPELKAKLDDQFWSVAHDLLVALGAQCRDAGVPGCCLIVPRAGGSDPPQERAENVDHYRTLARAAGMRVIDLSAAFDDCDPNEVSLAPWDDHPNAEGHKRLFLDLARQIVDDPALYRTLLGRDPGADPEASREDQMAERDAGR